MRSLLDWGVYIAVRTVFVLLGILTHSMRISLITAIFRLALWVLPRQRRYALRGLEIAFPDSTPAWRDRVLKQNTREIGRLVADSVRLPRLDEEWVRRHVTCAVLPDYAARLQTQEGKGILIATGHLGSFELLGHAIGLLGHPLAAVARSFKSPKLNSWWTGTREARGNRIIGRKGAFKEIVSAIQSGTSVAVLFDQNVTRNHAVFVDWFGVPAATSKSIALAALRTEVSIFVASIRYVGSDNYRIEAVECDCRDIYADGSLTTDQKVERITQRLSTEYCKMIAAFPEGWFWIHRRWKTRPETEIEGMYS